MTEPHVFSSTIFPTEKSGINAVLYVESIRSFAGKLSDSRIQIFAPETEKGFSPIIADRLTERDVELIRFEIEQDDLKFPFITEAKAAAIAEDITSKNGELLIWLTSNTLVLREPSAFLISPEYKFGYGPVHHKLLGSGWDEPLDKFWTRIYDICGVPEDNVFQMTGHIDGLRMRPYFNAGSFVVRPQTKILRSWRDTFVNWYQDEIFQDLYKKDNRYAVFVHQAILTGVVLSKLKREEMIQLPSTYNYPSHLHDMDVTDSKPVSLDVCHTIRHEGFYTDENWYDKMQASSDLRDWMRKSIIGKM